MALGLLLFGLEVLFRGKRMMMTKPGLAIKKTFCFSYLLPSFFIQVARITKFVLDSLV